MRAGGSRVRDGREGGSERDDREGLPSSYRGTLRGEVSQSGGGSGHRGWIKRKKYGTKLPAWRDSAGEGQTAA